MPLPPIREVVIGGKVFSFSYAVAVSDLMRGLSGVRSLEFMDGMLFDFSVDFAAVMSPRGMLFPLEIAFLDSAGVILEIQTMYPELNQYVFASTPVRYALEVPVGFFEANGLAVGAQLNLS